MTWGPMIDAIAKKARIRIGALYRMRSMLDSGNLKLMYIAFIRSILEYGSVQFMGAASCHLEKLDRIQRSAERIGNFKLESLQSRRQASLMSLTFKLLDGACREPLQVLAPQLTSAPSHSRNTRRAASHTGIQIKTRITASSLDCFKRSAMGVLPELWRSIPQELILKGANTGWRRINKLTKKFIINLDQIDIDTETHKSLYL